MDTKRGWRDAARWISLLALCAGIAACSSNDAGGSADGGDTVDTDGDGLADAVEPTLFGTHGTSPVLADTDGDGMLDGEEYLDFDPANPIRSSPLVADVPRLDIQITSAPRVTLQYTTAEGTSTTVTTERSASSSQSATSSHASSLTYATEQTIEGSLSISREVTAGVEAELGLTGGVTVSGEVSTGVEFTLGYSYATRDEKTFSWTQEQTRENQVALSRGQALEASTEYATSGGSLAVTVDVRNTGYRAFTLRNLYLGAALPDPAHPGRFLPVGNLEFESAFGFPETTLYAGQAAELWTFENDSLYLDTVKAILDNYKGLLLKVSSFELVDAEGRPFGFDYDTIGRRTATLVIDYGGEFAPERYMVATRTDPATLRITAADAMRYVGLEPSAAGSASGYQAGDFGWGDGTSATGLSSVRGIHAFRDASVPGAVKSGVWVAVRIAVNENGLLAVDTFDAAEASYDFDAIELKAGDMLMLAYRRDADGDGQFSRTEFLSGSVDADTEAAADSDGDGVSDGDEVAQRGTAPGLYDTDFDGLFDGDADTDGDDIPDTPADPSPLVPDRFQVEAGVHHNFVLKTDGSLMAWGYAANSQIGWYGNTTCGGISCQDSPDYVPRPPDRWIRVSAGHRHSAAIADYLSPYAWGSNAQGQTGVADAGALVPGPAVGLEISLRNWRQVAAGWFHTLAIDDLGRLFAWGSNHSGQLGATTTELCDDEYPPFTPSSIGCARRPVQVLPDTDWLQISAGEQHSVGIRSDGSLWAWGANGMGQLGDGTTDGRSVPTKISIGPYSGPWVKVAAGVRNTAAIHSDGSLWMWGDNSVGQLGIGCTVHRASPMRVGTDNDWADVAPGWVFTVAVKRDGSLWGWGRSDAGELGQVTTELCGGLACSTRPIRIGTSNGWVSVGAGAEHVVGVRSDGNVYAWGMNNYAQAADASLSNIVDSDHRVLHIAAGDVLPPFVVTTTPWNGATGVPFNSPVTATFNEPVDCATVGAATFTISPSVAGTVKCSLKTAIFTPTALAPDTAYTATITTGVSDLAGNPMAAPKDWTFRTASTPPAAPTGPWAGIVGSYFDDYGDRINVYGAKWTDAATNETGFEIQRSVSTCAAATEATFAPAGSATARSGTGTQFAYYDFEAAYGQTYCYRARAVNAAGYSAWVSAELRR